MSGEDTSHTSATNTILAGLGVYFLFFVLIFLDEVVVKTRFSSHIPEPIQNAIRFIYYPITTPLRLLKLL